MNVGELKKALENVPDECPVVIGNFTFHRTEGSERSRTDAVQAQYYDADSYEGFPDIFAIDPWE